jgi:hypothetical protein
MSTTVAFTPSTTQTFSFSPVINGVTYSATVTWNIWEQRYYVNLTTTAGVLVLSVPVVGSGLQLGVTLTWDDQAGGVATAVTASAHNVPIGQLANIRISQTGTGFDGNWQALATGPTTLTYALSNPDENQPLSGQLGFDVNLVATLGGGWLLYRNETQSFEYETTPSAS